MSLHRHTSTNEEENSTDASHRRHVDIATLSMPSSAAGSGVQSGEGTNFILEAPAHVIEGLAESGNHHQQNQSQPCIEGVVDLEAVSHLVNGMTDEEFVDLLHHDAPHAQQNLQSQSILSSKTMEPVMEVCESKDEEDGSSSASKENQPLLDNSSTISSIYATACIPLSADPFVQTLAEVHHHDQGQGDPVNENDGEDVTFVETIGSTESGNSFRTSFLRGSQHVEAGATHEHTMAREAFLLSVPATSGGSGGQYSGGSGTGGFVLAIPEMAGQLNKEKEQPAGRANGIAGSFLRHSTTSAKETFADFAMEMDRAFDPLPTDVQNVDLRVSMVPVSLNGEGLKGEGYQEELHLDVVVDRKVPVIGYVILVSGLVALSSIGAALDLQKGGVSPEMKILWRLNSTSILFMWLGYNKFNKLEFARFTKKQLFIEIPFAAANYAAMNTAFAASLEMTSMVNAFVLSNMASLLMIGAKFCVGSQVLFFEGLGALIGFAGALICAAAGGDDDNVNEDHRELQIESENEMGTSNGVMMGNMLAFSCSVTIAVYLTVAKRLRPQVDLVLFMFLIFTLASVILLVYIMVYSGQEYEFSFDPVIGVFGWLNLQADRLPLEIYVAVICNGIGTMGYVAIMKYFDPVVVTMVMLMEPIFAAFIGKWAGVSALPGWVTWAGDGVVTIGSILVISSGSRKTETIDATDALQHEVEQLDDSPTTLKKSSLMKSPVMMKNPLIVKKQNSIEEMEFECVGRKPIMHPTDEDAGHRVIWGSMQT